MRTKRLICVALILVIALMLCSCNLFEFANYGIKEVDALAIRGLEYNQNEGIYYAQLNTTFRIGLDWHNNGVVSPRIEWHIVNGDDDSKITGESASTLDYEISQRGDTIYKIYAIVSNIKSNEIKIRVTNAKLCAPKITSSTHDIVDNIIQQKLYEKSDVTLEASWNEDDIDPSAVVDIAWYVDDVKSTDNDREFTFMADDINDVDSVNIKVEISINGEQKQTSVVELVFIDAYALVDSVSVVVNDDAFDEVAEGTYYITASKTSTVSISLLASVKPSTSNLNALCSWGVQTSRGQEDDIIADREHSIPLTYGKNVISAKVENVQSRQIIVYVLQNEFDNLSDSIKNAITTKYIWQGNAHDAYINNECDLAMFMGYSISQHKRGAEYDMYVAKESWRDVDSLKMACAVALQEGNDESGVFSYTMQSSSSGDASIAYTDNTIFGVPQLAIDTDYVVEQANNYVRYKEVDNKRSALPIDDAIESVLCHNSNEIYRAVSNGYKPTFEDNEVGDKLSALYDKAREVLLKYIDDSMSEVQKVDVIFEWIVNEIDYDYSATDNTDGFGYKYNAFYLEGVFNDARAVCDGKSKAFALLCGMEGIRAKRIVGSAGQGDEKSGHAWNKVLIDANEDGIREWYVVDTTWSDAPQKKDVYVTEYINYAYYLITDNDIKDTHVSTIAQPTANTYYDVFDNIFILIDGKRIDLNINNLSSIANKRQLDTLIEYSKDNDSMYICISFSGSTMPDGNYSYIPIDEDVYIIRYNTAN